VIFDLWETLIDWSHDANARMHERLDAQLGFDFRERWSQDRDRYTQPVRTALERLGVPSDAMEDVMTIRADFVRECLVPRAGAVDTLRELRARGLLVGLITVCTEDVELLWPESQFAGPASRSPTRASTCAAASCSASSRTRRCSSATARTTSSRARGASAWTRS
jgi:hypothetical protein